MTSSTEPKIIQGGMGVGISSWQLAKTVSKAGQLGVVSGTALDSVWARRLQTGDPDGHFRRAMAHFPFHNMGKRIFDKYFSDTRDSSAGFKLLSLLTAAPTDEMLELLIVSNFVEVFLAKEGHDQPVGINYLEKIQMATPASAYGAMLAGVDYVLMGAGIPREIPALLDKLSLHEDVSLKLHVVGATSSDNFQTSFFPTKYIEHKLLPLKRPKFLAIISSSTLAMTLAKKTTGKIHGFIVEGATAGGHNAPPRGNLQLNDRGEPIYGPKDLPDLDAIRTLGLPFWLAGSYGSCEGLSRAISLGATGVQVGTAFALCKESGLRDDLKSKLLGIIKNRNLDVLTDPLASPTGFPFKIARLDQTLSEPQVYLNRPRNCDVGYLRQPYKMQNGKLGYRCPAEPVKTYLGKGGDIEDIRGRKCLCNALLANIGLGQHQKNGYEEQPLITVGDDVHSVQQFMKDNQSEYSAIDVIHSLLGQ